MNGNCDWQGLPPHTAGLNFVMSNTVRHLRGLAIGVYGHDRFSLPRARTICCPLRMLLNTGRSPATGNGGSSPGAGASYRAPNAAFSSGENWS